MADRDTELLISHDELMSVCKAQMEVILRAGLQKKLERAFTEAKVTPGFADRAEAVHKDFKRERLVLMANGEIH